uniref:Ig-like domain-containing protein n=1 Tax=Knipowitschia caucasica TaxID=637954 RepID=A0AAV2KN30_KNICA
MFRVLLVFSLVSVFSLVLATNMNLHETNHFLFAAPGGNITLPCFNKDFKDFGGTYYWYKQSLGKKTVCVSSLTKYQPNPSLLGEFNTSRRFSLDEDSLHYAALSVQSSSRQQRVTAQTDCVYSRLGQSESSLFLDKVRMQFSEEECLKRMAPVQMVCCLLLVQLVTVKSKDFQPSTDGGAAVKTTVLPVALGENVILPSFSENDLQGRLYWYKQSLDNITAVVSSYFGTEFYGDFANNDRFKLDNENNLEISKLLASVHVIVKTLNPGLGVHQIASEPVEAGNSLVLRCEVDSGTYLGPHRVHWFRQSEESAAVLYSEDQCKSDKTNPTNSCFYNLHIQNMSSKQTGTYYCAVAACGQVLFGNGTRLSVREHSSHHVGRGSLWSISNQGRRKNGDRLGITFFTD